MVNKFSFLILLLAGALFTSCGDKNTEDQSKNTGEESQPTLTLSTEQAALSGIETGSISRVLLHEKVVCNGTVESRHENNAVVAAIMKGYLKNLQVHLGEFVKKGEVLATLTHPDYIRLQEEYLETKSQYEYFKEDFKRQGELTLDQATSLKKMQEARNEFRKTEARLFALKHELQFIGINPDEVKVDNLQSDIVLKAPISGYIVGINAEIGMLCPEEEAIFELIGKGPLKLHLKVFEKDAVKIAPGQEVNFYLLSNPDTNYRAIVKTSTHNLDENNIINVYADILDQDCPVLPGMFVKAEINFRGDSAYVLPETGVYEQDKVGFIYQQLEKNRFRSIQVETGRKEGKWIELKSLPEDLLDADFAVKGAYELHAAFSRE